MRTYLGDEVETAEEPSTERANGSRPASLPAQLTTVGLVAAVVAGIALRLFSNSNLWLDEALSVNISQLGVSDIFEALRHDGHPPLYYLLLHYWMKVFGDGDVAVRLLSSVFGIAALPLAWIAGRRLAGPSGARWALVIFALSPFCIRYATETRMYSLVMLLVLAGYLILTDALREPTKLRLVALTLISGLLLLSHYWSFWLLGAVGLLLLWRWRMRPEARGRIARVLGALAAGGVFFLPWVPNFLYQSSHTGTPWAGPVRPTSLIEITLQDMGGGEMHEAKLGGMVLLVLCLIGLFVVRTGAKDMTLDVRTSPTVRLEMGVVALTAGIGCLVGYATGATFQSRYAAVFAPLILLVAAVGVTRIPGRARLVAGAVVLVLSLGGISWLWYFQRTQSGEVAHNLAELAQPDDVVVYCPDQLGPAYSREMPGDLKHMAYPTLTSPERVDWVDYKQRNANANPNEIASEILQKANGNAVFVVWMGSYETFGQQCETLVNSLGEQSTPTQPVRAVLSADDGKFYEPANLQYLPAR